MTTPSNDTFTAPDAVARRADVSIYDSVQLMRQRKKEMLQGLDEMVEDDIENFQNDVLRTNVEITAQVADEKEIMAREVKQAKEEVKQAKEEPARKDVEAVACNATILRLEQELAETKKALSTASDRRKDLMTNEGSSLDNSKGKEKILDHDNAPPAYNTRKRKAQVLLKQQKDVINLANTVTDPKSNIDAASVTSAAIEGPSKSQPLKMKKVKLAPAPAPAVEGDFILEVYRLARDKRRLVKVADKVCNTDAMGNIADLVEKVVLLMHSNRPRVNILNAVFVFRAENTFAPVGTELYLVGTSDALFAERWLTDVSYITRDSKPVIRFYVYSKGADEWPGDDLVNEDGF